MLEILGSNTRMCDRLSRRAMLRIGALAPLGLSLPAMLAEQARPALAAAATDRGFGRAKRCLLLFMWGGPAHQDLWDMKPNAPTDVRGEFNPVATNVPGIQFCEHLPQLAKQADKMAFVRSVTHTDNNHSTSAHWMLTGHKHPLSAENFGATANDFPHIGSVIARLQPADSGLPSFVSMSERIATTIGAVVPGQNAGRMGGQFDPFEILQHPDLPDFKVETVALPEGFSAERIAGRKNLLATMNQVQRQLDEAHSVSAMNSYYQRAADLITSTKAQQAFNLAAESPADRDRYGRQTFGQSVLLARRLLEAGVKLVTVYWHRDMPGVDTTWDTHASNFKQLKERLIPQVDQPIATLLDDLRQRGMLDDTLVVWSSEFGRTPKVNGAAGRDHWGRCNTIWLAGGGVPGGVVHGSSDKNAAEPDSDPVGPADVTATILHLLGISPEAIYHDRENRPMPASYGQPITSVLPTIHPSRGTP